MVSFTIKGNDLHLNPRKFKLFKKSVQHLGYTVDQNDLHKTKKKIQVIKRI